MSQENGRYCGRVTPETEPTDITLSRRYVLAVKCEALINKIAEEAEGDSYWTTPQRLEDGENGLPPINVLSTLVRIANKLQENNV